MQHVILEKRGNVGILTLNRPDAYNALNTAMLGEIERAAVQVEQDPEIRVLVVTGAGKAFVAGADISEMMNLTRPEAAAFAEAGHRAFGKLDNLHIPVIAAINGFALGGGLELALCCDIRIAAEGTKLGQPEVTLGITPGFGGTQRLPRAVGTSNAMLLVLKGVPITAEAALRMGLVSEVYPLDKLMDAAMELAQAIAKNAPIAVRSSKIAISTGVDRFLTNDLNYEIQLFSSCFGTVDQRMAMKAFLEKKPRDEFKGV
ncbi:MAG TPA: enoyl-CoA hydratase-related protein [Clostridia bacterium]|nr:enoyl-CoA hydratase-related protein [Clostridia bacterium]